MRFAVVAIALLMPILAFGDDSPDLSAWAKRIAAASLQTTGTEIERELEALGHIPEEVQRIRDKLFKESAACFVKALAEQTSVQNLPLEPILRGFAKSPDYSLDDFHIAQQLDFKAFGVRLTPCAALAYYQAGLQPR